MALSERNPVGTDGNKTTEYTNLTCKVNKQDWVSDETTITEVTYNMSLGTIKIPSCSNVFGVEN